MHLGMRSSQQVGSGGTPSTVKVIPIGLLLTLTRTTDLKKIPIGLLLTVTKEKRVTT